MTEDRIIEWATKFPFRMPTYSGLCRICGEVFFTHTRSNSGICGKVCVSKSNSMRLGESAKGWRGGRIKTADGYIRVHAVGHPAAHMNKVLEHRLVMERHIGRYLLHGENVHHKNGVRDDNRIENLELWCKPQAAGQRVDDLISFVTDNYEKEVRAKLEVRDLVNSVIDRVCPAPIRKESGPVI